MWKSANNPYIRVVDSDEGDVEEDRTRPESSRSTIVLIIIYTLLVLTTGVIIGQGFKEFGLAWSTSGALQHRCSDPKLRQEWRDLSTNEQQDYIKAAQCFSALPNPYGSKGTLYDEFSRVHRSVGSFSHESASFLPWHRYFLHIYESTLIAQCDFRGSLPYWDWTKDWQDFSNSSIWNGSTGFGGNGNATTGQGVGEGNCVTDGPFSMLRPVYYNQSSTTHCLSRGFGRGNNTEQLLNSRFSPIAIETLLQQESYEDLLTQLESEIHDSIHRLIGGDFRAWTAPNDPIFFLHHAQLDRLWWRWQQLKPNTRFVEYTGQHMVNSSGNASLSDRLFVDTLAVDNAVGDVMSIQGKILCYDYI